MMRKITSLLLTALMLATMLTMFAVPASAVPERKDTANSNNIGKWAKFDSDSPSILINLLADDCCFIVDVDGVNYIVAIYSRMGSDYIKHQNSIHSSCFSNLVPTEDIPAKVRAMAEKDYPDLVPTGSTLSEGSLTIIVGVAAAVVFGLGGFILGKAAGKKKKTALASGENTDEE